MYIWIYVHTYEGGAGCVLKDKSAAFRPLPHHSRVAVHEWDIEGFNKQFDHATKWPNESLILVYLSLPCLSPTKLTKSAASRIWISTYFVCRAHFYTWVHTYTRWERAGVWSKCVGVGSRAPGCVHVCLFTQRTHTLSKYLGTNTCTGARTQISNEPQNLEPRGWIESRISKSRVCESTRAHTLYAHTLCQEMTLVLWGTGTCGCCDFVVVDILGRCWSKTLTSLSR